MDSIALLGQAGEIRHEWTTGSKTRVLPNGKGGGLSPPIGKEYSGCGKA
jgi:hypothetical protein